MKRLFTWCACSALLLIAAASGVAAGTTDEFRFPDVDRSTQVGVDDVFTLAAVSGTHNGRTVDPSYTGEVRFVAHKYNSSESPDWESCIHEECFEIRESIGGPTVPRIRFTEADHGTKTVVVRWLMPNRYELLAFNETYSSYDQSISGDVRIISVSRQQATTTAASPPATQPNRTRPAVTTAVPAAPTQPPSTQPTVVTSTTLAGQATTIAPVTTASTSAALAGAPIVSKKPGRVDAVALLGPTAIAAAVAVAYVRIRRRRRPTPTS